MVDFPGKSDVERWERELIAAGWRRYRYRGRESKTLWVSPHGTVHRGPHGAWEVMGRMKKWQTEAVTK